MQTCADYLQGGPRLLTDFNIWWLLLLLTAKLEFKTYCLKAQFSIWNCKYKKVASGFEECLWTFSNLWKIQQIFNFLNVELVLACTLVFNIPTKTLQTLHLTLIYWNSTNWNRGIFQTLNFTFNFKEDHTSLWNIGCRQEIMFYTQDDVRSSWVSTIIENPYSPE